MNPINESPSQDDDEEEKQEETSLSNAMANDSEASKPFSLVLSDTEMEPYHSQDFVDQDQVLRRALDLVETVQTWVETTRRAKKRDSIALQHSVKSVRAVLTKMKSRYTKRRSSMFTRDIGHFDTTMQMMEALRGLGLCLRDIYETETEDLVCVSKSRFIVEQVARIPNFVPTVLLMKNEDLKEEILSLPVVTRAIMNKYSVLPPEDKQQQCNAVKSSTITNIGCVVTSVNNHRSRDANLTNLDSRRMPQDAGAIGTGASSLEVNNLDESDADLNGIPLDAGVGGTGAVSPRAKHLDGSAATPEGAHNATTTTGRSGILSSSPKCWLLRMLKNPSSKELAVEYLEIISNLRVKDYMRLPIRNDEDEDNDECQVEAITPSKEDIAAFNVERVELFQAISQNDKLILRLFTLKTADMERAGVTAAVRWALNEELQRPFMITLVFCDYLFHIVLLVVFRTVLFRAHFGADDPDDIVAGIMTFCILYFWFRFVLELAMLKVSFAVFWRSVTYSWTLIELASTLMVTTSWALLDAASTRRAEKAFFAYQAFTIGVLWLKLLGFLQIMNSTLAAYIHSMTQIIYDMGWFIIITLVMILGFGDMFFVIYGYYRTPDETGTSACSVEIESPFCDTKRGVSYLAIYRLFVGDVQAEEFNQSPVTTFLFVVVTFFGVIVLLNMLIAIVTTSYESSRRMSDRFFGKARIALVAKGIALEHLVKPSANRTCCKRWLSISLRILTSMVLFYLGALAGSIFYYLSFLIFDLMMPTDVADPMSGVISAVVCLYLWSILMVYLWAGWEGQQKSKCYRFAARRGCFNYGVIVPVKFVTLTLLGLKPWRKQTPQQRLQDGGWAREKDFSASRTLPMFDISSGDTNGATSGGDVERHLTRIENEQRGELFAMERRAAERDAKHRKELEDIKRKAAEREATNMAKLEAMEQRAIRREEQHKAILQERDEINKSMITERNEQHELRMREMEVRILGALKSPESEGS